MKDYEKIANSIIKNLTSIDPKNVEEQVLEQILHKCVDTDTLFKYLTDVDGDLYTVVLMEIANVIYDNNLKLTHGQKESIKKHTMKQNNLNQIIILSFILKERLENNLYMKRTPIQFFPKVDIETVVRILTHDEIEHYFKYFTSVDTITSLEMFKVIIMTSEFFRENWSYDIDLDNVKSIQNSAIKYFTPEFLVNTWRHIPKNTQQKAYKLFYDEYKFDNEWTNTLKEIAPEPEDIV